MKPSQQNVSSGITTPKQLISYNENLLKIAGRNPIGSEDDNHNSQSIGNVTSSDVPKIKRKLTRSKSGSLKYQYFLGSKDKEIWWRYDNKRERSSGRSWRAKRRTSSTYLSKKNEPKILTTFAVDRNYYSESSKTAKDLLKRPKRSWVFQTIRQDSRTDFPHWMSQMSNSNTKSNGDGMVTEDSIFSSETTETLSSEGEINLSPERSLTYVKMKSVDNDLTPLLGDEVPSTPLIDNDYEDIDSTSYSTKIFSNSNSNSTRSFNSNSVPRNFKQSGNSEILSVRTPSPTTSNVSEDSPFKRFAKSRQSAVTDILFTDNNNLVISECCSEKMNDEQIKTENGSIKTRESPKKPIIDMNTEEEGTDLLEHSHEVCDTNVASKHNVLGIVPKINNNAFVKHDNKKSITEPKSIINSNVKSSLLRKLIIEQVKKHNFHDSCSSHTDSSLESVHLDKLSPPSDKELNLQDIPAVFAKIDDVLKAESKIEESNNETINTAVKIIQENGLENIPKILMPQQHIPMKIYSDKLKQDEPSAESLEIRSYFPNESINNKKSMKQKSNVTNDSSVSNFIPIDIVSTLDSPRSDTSSSKSYDTPRNIDASMTVSKMNYTRHTRSNGMYKNNSQKNIKTNSGTALESKRESIFYEKQKQPIIQRSLRKEQMSSELLKNRPPTPLFPRQIYLKRNDNNRGENIQSIISLKSYNPIENGQSITPLNSNFVASRKKQFDQLMMTSLHKDVDVIGSATTLVNNVHPSNLTSSLSTQGRNLLCYLT